MTLLAMDFKAISTAPWRVTKYRFTSLVAANRTEVGRFLRKRTNTAHPLLPPIGGAALPPLINRKKGWSGLNLHRTASVGGSYPLFFDCVINQIM